jgi:hypothetical protein
MIRNSSSHHVSEPTVIDLTSTTAPIELVKVVFCAICSKTTPLASRRTHAERTACNDCIGQLRRIEGGFSGYFEETLGRAMVLLDGCTDTYLRARIQDEIPHARFARNRVFYLGLALARVYQMARTSPRLFAEGTCASLVVLIGERLYMSLEELLADDRKIVEGRRRRKPTTEVTL